jgi:glucose/mannose-6-phosphate isomerase
MASPLDDRGFVSELDPKGMLGYVERFADQCREALRISREAAIGPHRGPSPRLAMLTGLGGSAAGGDLTKCLFEAESRIPFLVNRDYSLPSYVDDETVVIATSYSGNTEETLASYDDARAKRARLIVVTSGGALAERAERDGVPLILIPGGQPPRTALGYLFVPVVWAAEAMGFLAPQDYDSCFSLLDDCASLWGVDAADNPAKRLASALQGRLAVLYGLGGWQGAVANRWKGQINENAKNMCFANAFPELNHNEILGWVGADRQGVAGWDVVVLEDGRESAKMKARAEVTLGLIREQAREHHARALGDTLLERMLTLTYLGDWVSIYLAALNRVDPENIDWINVLKSELAKVP